MTALDFLGTGLVIAAAVNLAASLATIVLSRPLGRPAWPSTKPASPARVFPFVSVHVATYDEPPAMVIATIEALTRLDYPAFEIIVIDNNTTDPAVWRPVARRVAELGPSVRFLHRDGVQGAKAGALNIALALTDPRAAYVAVVDADYIVAPNFLRRAMMILGQDVQFVQFPQCYRQAAGAAAVIAELSDYFETFPRAANRAQAALLTGTLSVIALSSLRAVGGWPTGSITEDAELGVKLWRSGARGLFVHEKVGDGLLPLDLAGLRLQRQRWVSGNIQTLLGARRAVFSAPSGGVLAVVAQLTAWTGFLALPLASLIASALVRAITPAPACWRMVEYFAAATILIVLAGHLLRAVTRRRPAMIAVTLAMLWTGSFAWLAAFGPRPLRFRRTPKAAAGTAGCSPSLDTIGGVVALATAGALAVEGVPLAAFSLALSASGLIASPLVDYWLRRAAARRIAICVA